MTDEAVASGPAEDSRAARDLPRVDFQAIFDASPQPLLVMAADAPKFTMVAVNEAHARTFRTTSGALIGRGVLEVFGAQPPPEVAPFVEAIRTSLARVMETGGPDQMAVRPYPIELPDGTPDERYWSAVNAPVFGPDGRLTHIVSAVSDVTGEVYERRGEEARQLLMREVDHRARNALTVVQSFVRLATARSLEEFRKGLAGRVEALGRAQTSLAARRWEGASLQEVLEGELSALAEPARYTLNGPHILLPAEDVQPMSMIVHELATNASKYGAFSTPQGRLAVSWTRGEGGPITVRWAEDSGAAIARPGNQGFGSQLVANLARQMRGEVSHHWRPEGLEVEIRIEAA
ncbi:MAG: HWE histidine kinase domain-containing protein [Caulobacterales bacterium]